MRSLLLLAAICCLALSVYAGPIKQTDGESEKELSRQSAAAPAAAPAATDDDDDEDEDDDDDEGEVDIDDAIAGDDDDDDDDEEEGEEADDDEDDDYLERFFDDILGGEEDDDEDDSPSVVKPVVAPADTVAAAPASVSSVAAGVDEGAVASEEASDIAENEAIPEGEEPEGGQREPASAEVESPVAASSEVQAPAEPEEDDEEEEDEDISDALDPEDDDDDDDEEDEEEDDDDDDDLSDALGRNVSAKHARALPDEPESKQVPATYIIKYNKFVDNILEKMNDILRRSYDPVSVKLQPIDASKKSSKPKKNKTKTNNRKTSNKKKNSARGSVPVNKNGNKVTEDKQIDSKTENKEVLDENVKFNSTEKVAVESRATKDKNVIKSGKAKSTTAKPTSKPKPTKNTKPKPKPPVKTTTKKPAKVNKIKSSEKTKPRARGTLYGLSSLKRSGDVAVNIMSDHSTIKSNFGVGPLILRVEKEVGRGAKKELKSATATTAEMSGKITLRINNDGVATLHSIKVLQPKQVHVDSNHERTRELVWRRSARIAYVVSEKLKSASKPMFENIVKQ